MDSVASMSTADRVGEALRRSLPRLGPEARAEVEKLLTPEVLATVAAVLAVWVGSHFFGIGEIVDIVLLVAGLAAIGLAVFDGVEEFLAFATLALNAQSESDLDRAGEHFAKAVMSLGVQTVLAVLFRGAPKTWRGGRINPGPPPKFVRGAVSRPPLRSTRSEPKGTGVTWPWGDIVISRLGTRSDRRLAALHESVHRMLTPKVNMLRTFRVSGRFTSYTRSPLSLYLEEAMAEVVAQVGVNGIRGAFSGMSFPVSNGYVTLLRKGVVNRRELYPVLPELAGLIAGGFMIGGELFESRFSPRKPPMNSSECQ